MREWPEVVQAKWPAAVFLDRDGTLVEDTHFPFRVEDLRLITGVAEGLARLAELPLHIVVASNQAGIALGIFTVDEMRLFNSELRARVQSLGGRIDAFYYCPHLGPEESPGSHCDCAKPSPGMLREAARDLELDLGRSFLVGDKSSDMTAGRTAGCSTILVLTGEAGRESGGIRAEPDFTAATFDDAAHIIDETFRIRAALLPQTS